MRLFTVDLGGTRIKLSLVRDTKVIESRLIDSNSDLGLKPKLHIIAENLKMLAQANYWNKSDALILGFPGLVNRRSGRVTQTYNKYDDAINIDLEAWCREKLQCSFFIENDTRLAALGEWRFGAGEGCDNFVIVTLGTGFGTTAIVDGKVLRGAHGHAGNYGGHLTIDYHGDNCTCGNVGCPEAQASTSVLSRVYRKFFGSDTPGQPEILDYRWIFKQADLGNPVAKKLRDYSLIIWSNASVNLVNAYDPDRLIIGGGIAKSFQAIAPAIKRAIRHRCPKHSRDLKILPSQLGDKSASLGCYVLIKELNHDKDCV